MSGMEVVEGVHRIEAEVGGRPLYLFLFLGERRLLLDAGCASSIARFVVPSLAQLGLDLEDLDLLVVTHSDLDHQGGVHALKAANPGLLVSCGAADVPLVADPEALVMGRYDAFRADHGIGYDDETLRWMREESGKSEPVEIRLTGGESIRLGPGWQLSVLHVPGHSPGHLALFDSRSGALFSGDCVQGSVYLGLDGTPKLCPTYTDVDPYLETVAKIEALEPRELHGCHWPAARGDGVQSFLAETRGYVEQIDELVRGSLTEPATLQDLIDRVNSRLEGPWPDGPAQELVYSLHGHAERLVEQGLATRDRSRPVVYRSSA